MPDEGEFFLRAQEMMACYERGDYSGALAVTGQLAAAFPVQAARTDYWRICLLARQQKIKEALLVFRNALDANLWWSESTLRSDPDLKPLQGLPEYERMVAVCKERHAAAQAASKPVLVVRKPVKSAKSPPVLIALHGHGSTTESELTNWEKACPMGWLVAAIQSSQQAWPGAYTWIDRDKAQEEIVVQYKSLCAQYPIDLSRVIIGGFSQGAALAIRLALNGSIPVCGFLAVSLGMIDQQLLTAWAETTRGQAVRGYLVAGGKDQRYEFFKRICATLPNHGILCQMEDHPELGHLFPADFERSLESGLKFLLA